MTYNTVNYAVSIIDEIEIEDMKKEDYSAVFKRYKKYKICVIVKLNFRKNERDI